MRLFVGLLFSTLGGFSFAASVADLNTATNVTPIDHPLRKRVVRGECVSPQKYPDWGTPDAQDCRELVDKFNTPKDPKYEGLMVWRPHPSYRFWDEQANVVTRYAHGGCELRFVLNTQMLAVASPKTIVDTITALLDQCMAEDSEQPMGGYAWVDPPDFDSDSVPYDVKKFRGNLRVEVRERSPRMPKTGRPPRPPKSPPKPDSPLPPTEQPVPPPASQAQAATPPPPPEPAVTAGSASPLDLPMPNLRIIATRPPLGSVPQV